MNKKLQVQSVKDSSNSTFTKSSTLLVENSRKTKFLHSFSQEQNANLLPFFVYACRLGWKFWKGTFFEKEVRYFHLSSEWYFDVNIVRSSSISHFTKRWFTELERGSHISFCCFQAISLKAQKGTFFAVGSDVLKSIKMVPFLQLEVMLLKVRKRYLFKNIK